MSFGDFVEILSTPGGTQGVPGGYLGALGATLGGTGGVRAISGGALGSQRGVAGGVSRGFLVTDASPRAGGGLPGGIRGGQRRGKGRFLPWNLARNRSQSKNAMHP